MKCFYLRDFLNAEGIQSSGQVLNPGHSFCEVMGKELACEDCPFR